MKRRTFFSLLLVVLIMSFLDEWIIPVSNGRTAAIGGAIILVGIFLVERIVMYITNHYQKRKENSGTQVMHILLESFIMHNRYKMGYLTEIILVALVLLHFSINDSFILRGIIIITLITFAFLSSPRSIVMNDNEVKYNLGWKEKFENISSFTVHDKDIYLHISNGRIRKIRNIASFDIDKVIGFLSTKIQVI